jgi:hypothetical protein
MREFFSGASVDVEAVQGGFQLVWYFGFGIRSYDILAT